MPTSSLLRPVDTELMTPVTQTWCPLFARIESFTNKDKNLDRADNNWLVRQTLYVPTLSSENNHCMVTILCCAWCSDQNWSWSVAGAQLLITAWREDTRHDTDTDDAEVKIECERCVANNDFSIIMMFDLLYRGRKTVKCKYSASISDRPQLRRHRDGETMMSRWPDLGQCQPIRGQYWG